MSKQYNVDEDFLQKALTLVTVHMGDGDELGKIANDLFKAYQDFARELLKKNNLMTE